MMILGYFDPGSGSLLVQAIVGGMAGILVFGKYLWDTFAMKFRDPGNHSFRPEFPSMPDVGALSTASSGEIPISRF